MGYSAAQARDAIFETADTSGVVGLAQGIGVRGKGDNGGVQGVGTGAAFGVQGSSDLGPGVQGVSPGGTGVMGQSKVGDGVHGMSDQGIGGVFLSQVAAQVRLQPHPKPLNNPNGSIAGGAGDLVVLQVEHEGQVASLWFCRVSGNETSASWVQIA